MADNLVIVESPSKAKTIEKFLGKRYKVMASVGHVRDLPKSKLGVDVDNNFEPQYITIRGKGPVVADLKREKKKAKRVFIATDPDREGEAIAWHLTKALDLPEDQPMRVKFHEITKQAVTQSIKTPTMIDQPLVDSQQARRILDRLVGYEISPILWRKVMKGLSAGRVQSVATRLVVLREREIQAFEPKEYWRFLIDFKAKKGTFQAEVTRVDDKKLSVDNQTDAATLEDRIKKAHFTITGVQNREKKRQPYPPFTTSTLQQDASSKLNFSPSKTMMVAQKLYEGLKVKEGVVGLITYMRTDSTRISEDSRAAAADLISQTYGKQYLHPRQFNSKKSAMDAHEAIRPTDPGRTPDSVTKYLGRDELKLYSLIWQRFMASQMTPAKFNTTTVLAEGDHIVARARGDQLLFDGFLKVYNPGLDKDLNLPAVEQGEDLHVDKLSPEQKFTQPPNRFTEASLIKEMEDLGIGRPSTFAPTMYTILKRGYVVKEKKALKPTELGEVTNTILEENFLEFVEPEFTAEMEDKLDHISDNNAPWQKVVSQYYDKLKPLVKSAEDNVKKYDMSELTDIPCDKCGKPMLIKKTIKGNFYACSGYPECKNTKPILKEIGIKCPQCEDGQIVERKTRKLKTFYGCSNFPDCTFASWNKPIDRPCPKCGSLLAEGTGKVRYLILCTNKDCDYQEKKTASKTKNEK